MERTRKGLTALTDPSVVAVVGASDSPDRIGGRVFSYLASHFRGSVLPVNPHRATVQGTRAVPSVCDLPEAPDLVVVAVPADSVLDQARRCAAVGAKAMLVLTAGFAEIGAEGVQRQAELTAIAAASGMRICGPNCLGMINVRTGVIATFSDLTGLPLIPGPIALVSQSGAFGAQVFRKAQRSGLGIGEYYSTGNEADITVAQLVAELIERDDVSVVLAILEAIGDPEILLAAGARARELGKTIACVKIGRSLEGARAAMSHTGSLTGSDSAVDAAFRAAGILRANRMDQLLNWARAFQYKRLAHGNRVGIVTTSGGVGVLLTDAARERNLSVPSLDAGEQARLRKLMPAFASAGNPVDCTGQIVNDVEIIRGVLDVMTKSASLDVLCIAGLPDLVTDGWREALRSLSGTTMPVVAWCGTTAWTDELNRVGIPGYLDPTDAMDVAAALVRSGTGRVSSALARRRPGGIDRKAGASLAAAPRRVLLEPQAAGLLRHWNISMPACRVVTTEAGAAAAAAQLGYPVVLKALSADLPHRSDIAAVRLDLSDEELVRDAYRAILANVGDRAPAAVIDGILVQRQVPRGLELVLGMRRDPTFGPIVTVGLGGVLVELIADTVPRLAPLDLDDAASALAEIAGGRLVRLNRGLTASDQERLAVYLVALGDLAVVHPEIAEIDLNPVTVVPGQADSPARIVAVDALIVISSNADMPRQSVD